MISAKHAGPVPTRDRHEVLLVIAALGAAGGVILGAFGGVSWMIGGGAAGAILGTLVGVIRDRQIHLQEVHERELDDLIGVTAGTIGLGKEAPAPPVVEPACRDCDAVRVASGGTVQRCTRHDHARLRTHTHYEYPKPFAMGSLLFRG